MTLPFSGCVHYLSIPNNLSRSTFKITGGCKCTCPSIHFYCASSTHKHTQAHSHRHRDRTRDGHTHRHRHRQTDTQTRLLKRREKRRAKRAGAGKERVGPGHGAMYHQIKHSSVKYSLRCVCIMYLVCCVGESLWATSHLLYVLPCRSHATRAVRPPKRNPKCICLPSVAKRCMEATKNKIHRGFLNCWSHH